MDMGDMSDGSSSSSSDNSTSSSMSMDMSMKAYLHFTKGDVLIFDTIVPSSAGAIVGACFVIFFLSVFERWLRAFRQSLDIRFQARALHLVTEYGSDVDKLPLSDTQRVAQEQPRKFVLSHRIASGGLTAIETTLHYLLMLIIMTFNASFIISAILGAVVGDMAFRRHH
ncbi:hypothetical protein BDZ89DRAFT_1057429 [Hymenopellis radicata]|nr:hypothetical protein BDZ89DRAFT_1057429 [Hymenopellis radicata]